MFGMNTEPTKKKNKRDTDPEDVDQNDTTDNTEDTTENTDTEPDPYPVFTNTDRGDVNII